MQLGFKVPVLLLVSILAFIEGLEALLESLRLKLKSRRGGLEILVFFISFGKDTLEIANLGDERSTDLGGEFDIVDSVGRLVANLAIRDGKLRRGSSCLDLKLGRADRSLEYEALIICRLKSIA